jgi:CBS domain-containing protein
MQNRLIKHILKDRELIAALPDTLVCDAAQQMREAHVGALAVVQEGSLIGIFTERDALNRIVAEGLSPQGLTLKEVMTIRPTALDANSPFDHALHLMFENDCHHVPVIENGHPVGIVSAREAFGLEMVQFEHELEQREDISQIL